MLLSELREKVREIATIWTRRMSRRPDKFTALTYASQPGFFDEPRLDSKVLKWIQNASADELTRELDRLRGELERDWDQTVDFKPLILTGRTPSGVMTRGLVFVDQANDFDDQGDD